MMHAQIQLIPLAGNCQAQLKSALIVVRCAKQSDAKWLKKVGTNLNIDAQYQVRFKSSQLSLILEGVWCHDSCTSVFSQRFCSQL